MKPIVARDIAGAGGVLLQGGRLVPVEGVGFGSRGRLASRLPFVICLLALAAGGCRRGGQSAADAEAAAAREAAAAQAELARWQVAREREALEWERAELDRQRRNLEAAQAQQQAEERAALDQQAEELARREEDLAAREAAGREAPPLPSVSPLPAADPEPAAPPLTDWVPAAEPVTDYEPVADYGTFYDDLEPYGDWYETADYGYVWQPTVVVQTVAWRPYCHGRWVWTDCGWMWVSDEPFGWATYHYGNWVLLAGRGWAWVPGSVWAPAWVCWRMGGDHVGWAPLPPECRGDRRPVWGSGVEHDFGIGADWFCFVRLRHFGGSLGSHCLPPYGNRALLGTTTNVTLIRREAQRVWVGGPDHRELGRRLGRELPSYTLETDPLEEAMRRPAIREGRLRIYAPPVAAAWNPLLRPREIKEQLGPVARDGSAGRWAGMLRDRREAERRTAEQQLARLGGDEDLSQLRAERLRGNRERLVAAAAGTAPPADRPTAEAAKPTEVPTTGRPIPPGRPDRTQPPAIAGSVEPEGEEPTASPPTGGESEQASNRRPWGQRAERSGRVSPAAQDAPDTAAREPAAADLSTGPRARREPPGRQLVETRQPTIDAPDPAQVEPPAPPAPATATDASALPAELSHREGEPVPRSQVAVPPRGQREEARQRPTGEPHQQVQDTQSQQAENMQRQAAEEARQRQIESQQRQRIEDTQRQQAEEMQRRAAEEARQQQMEDRRRQQIEEAQRQRGEEMQRRAAEEARERQMEEQRQRMEEAQRQRAEEVQRRAAEEDRQRQMEEQRQRMEEAQRQRAEEVQRRAAEEARERQMEEQRRQQAEEAQRRQAEEMQRRQAEEGERRQSEERERRQSEERERRVR